MNASDRVAALQAQINKLQSELDDLSGEEGKVRAFLDALVADSSIEINAAPSQLARLIGLWEYWRDTGSLPSV